MTNFIRDNTALPDVKIDYRPRPEIPANKKVVAVDYNALRTANLDTQSWLRGGEWHGLAKQMVAPTPAGVASFMYLDGDGEIHVVHDAVDELVLQGARAGFVTPKSYFAKGDGVTDDRAALQAAVVGANALGAALELGDSTYLVSRDGANPWCLNFQGLENVVIRGVKGKAKIIAQAGMPDAGGIPVIRFNGCRGGGIYDVTIDGNWGNYSGEITYQSNGLALPQATIYVDSTDGAPTSGTIGIVVGTTLQTITYTGKTATTFTGCTGGTGTLRTGAGVGRLDANTGINHTTQSDPRNHGIMLRGCENFEVHGCTIQNVYGDMVWIGFRGDPIEDGYKPCKNVRITGVWGKLSARHGVSISQSAEDITIRDSQFRHVFGIPMDAEAQGQNQAIRRLRIDGGYYGLWWNPTSAGRSQSLSLSIKGAGVLGLLDAESAVDCSVSNAVIEGSCAIWASRGVTVFNNTFRTDWDHGASNGSYAPIFVDHLTDDIDILHNRIYDRGAIVAGAADGDPSRASVVVQSYSTTLRPSGVRVIGNKIRVRNGRDGIKISGGGARLSGTQSYTATSITATTVVVTGAGWAAGEHIGKTIYRSGLVASVAGNTSDTLTHTGWFRPSGSGSVETTPAAGLFRLVMTAGTIVVADNDVDCFDDGNGAGGYGISVYTKLSGGAVQVRNNRVRCATAHAYHFDLTASFSELLEVVGNHAFDDQQVKTTTTGFWFAGTQFLTQLILHGNTTAAGITHLSGLTSGSWQTSNSYPGSWAGYQDPNGVIFAPATATYQRLDSRTLYVKQSPESSSSGWQAVTTAPRTVLRGVGTAVSGSGNVTPGLPPSVDGDIEILVATNHDPSTLTTLSVPAGFVKKVDADSLYLFHNRGSIWWRRFKTGMGAPTVNNPTGINGAVILSFRDCIPYGDPFADAQAAADNDGNNTITYPAATSTEDNSLVVQVATVYCGGGGGTPGTISGYTNAGLAEIEEATDNRLAVGSDVFNLSAVTARKVTAGAITATTATMLDSYQIACCFTLVLKPAQISSRATGTITCVAKASMVDTDFMTIGDGLTPAKVYEFDVAGNGVTGGRVQVNISTDTTAAQVAARLRTAILANQPALSVVDNADGTLSLQHNWLGSGGNVAMSENVANAGFLVTGMSGGAG